MQLARTFVASAAGHKGSTAAIWEANLLKPGGVQVADEGSTCVGGIRLRVIYGFILQFEQIAAPVCAICHLTKAFIHLRTPSHPHLHLPRCRWPSFLF